MIDAAQRGLGQVTFPETRNWFYALILEGHTAVSLFMVLSGFIFTYGALGRRIVYGDFIINRIARIYPLYLTVILVSLAINPQGYTIQKLVSTVLPLANYASLDGSLLSLSWAVAIELQFYLIFPFLLIFFNDKPFSAIFGVIAVAIIFRVLGIGLDGNPRDLSYLHLLGRIDQFVLGMGAAFLLKRLEPRVATFRLALLGSIIFAVALIYAYHRNGGFLSVANWKIFWPTAEGLAWAAFLVSYIGAKAIPNFVSKILTKIGEASFSIYLLHFPIIQIVTRRPDLFGHGDPLMLTAFAILPVIVAISWLTYNVIELPFLGLRRKYLV